MNLVAGVGLSIELFGHLAICCAVYNQLHATSWPRLARKLLDKLIYGFVLALAAIIVQQAWMGEILASQASDWLVPLTMYRWICMAAAAAVTIRWFFRRQSMGQLSRVIVHPSDARDWRTDFERPPIHGIQARLLSCIPGNQVLQPVVEQRTIIVRGLPAESSGLRIVQWSDLHFNGKIGIEYFSRVVDLSNEWSPDFVVITGDLVDKKACLGWLDQTLGRITAKMGRYYILGNHDRRIQDTNRLRGAIEATGFQPLNGRWHRQSIPGGSLWLCGNELPWYRGAELLSLNPPDNDRSPRILLSHSPDQIRWAASRNIDLMLSGHCHGGQIRLPLIGPIISPSRYGVRFASGSFEIGRTTLLVSRGISADDPIRLNCPPELTNIELVRG